MDTKSIGDKYESEAYDMLREELENGGLGIRSDRSKIFQKKRYFSNKRNDFIEFDIAIEVYADDDSKPILTFIMECKKYSGRVPVNDIEEFYNKVQQVRGLNVKAILISNAALQSGAESVARADGIGFIRFSAGCRRQWVLHRHLLHTFRSDRLIRSIAESDEEMKNIPYICYNDGTFVQLEKHI